MSDNTKTTRRVRWLDMARGINIFLVMYAHAVSSFRPEVKWICSFFIPLFFIISGYCYKFDEKFVAKNTKKILIPYLKWGGIGFLFGLAASLLTNEFEVHKGILDAVNLLLGRTQWNYPLWFLAAYLITKLVYDGICFVKNKTKIAEKPIGEIFEWTIVVAFTIAGYLYSQYKNTGHSVFRFDTGFVMLLFFAIGHKLAITIKNTAIKKETLLITGASALLINIFSGCVFNDLVSNSSNEYGNVVLFVISSLTGSLFVFCICKIFEERKTIAKPLSWLGKNSMTIMCTHALVYYSVEVVLIKFIKIQTPTIVSLMLCVGMEIIFVLLFNKAKEFINTHKNKQKHIR